MTRCLLRTPVVVGSLHPSRLIITDKEKCSVQLLRLWNGKKQIFFTKIVVNIQLFDAMDFTRCSRETKSTNTFFFSPSSLPPIIIIIIYDIEKGDGGELITIYDFLWRRMKKDSKKAAHFYESWDQNDRMELATLSWIHFEDSSCNRFSRITFLYVIHIEAWSQTQDINSDGREKRCSWKPNDFGVTLFIEILAARKP